MARFVDHTIKGGGQLAPVGAPPATPAPVFTTAPSISPTSGTVGSTFTGNDGTITNGTVSARQWLLNGTAISGATGASYVTAAAGSLTYQVTATGAGGTATGTSAAVAVSAAVSPSTFTTTQLASPMRTYQRATFTGGSQGFGAGNIPQTINATATGGLYSRLRASNGSTILRASSALPAITTTGSQVIQIPADVRLGWFFVDLSADGATWQNGTTLVGMGAVIGLSGQSLADRKMYNAEGGPTIASLGLTINPYGTCSMSYLDSTPYTSLAWALPSDSGPYSSSYPAAFLNDIISQVGFNVSLVGHSHGGTAISSFLPGNSDNTYLRAALDAAGGFEAFIWDHGHANVTTNAPGYYTGALTSLFNDITSRNIVLGSNYTKLIDTIPIITNGYGPTSAINQLRLEMQTWAANNGAAFNCTTDLTLNSDGIHPGQVGGVQTARHDYRALRTHFGLSNADTGPIIMGATRASNSNAVVLATSLASGAALVSTGSPLSRLILANSGSTTTLAIASLSVSGATITATLSANPGNTQAIDVYWGYPYDPSTDGSVDMIRDNVVDGDGFAIGRQLQPNLTPITAAAPGGSVALATLSLSPTTATAGSPYSGTISNNTPGSTISATSSDGTTLAVSGTAVSGTFSAAGSPTITLIETLAGATGSPRTTNGGVTIAASAAPLTWATPGVNATFVFTNGNLTAHYSGGSVQGPYITTNRALTGKKVFTATCDAFTGDYADIGVGSNVGDGQSLGFTGSAIAVYTNGAVFYNGNQVGSAPRPNTGTTTSVLIDYAAALLWFTQDGVNFYGAGGTFTAAQVAAGTGGFDISGPKAAGQLYGAAGGRNNTNIQWTLATSYPYTLPTGFTNL